MPPLPSPWSNSTYPAQERNEASTAIAGLADARDIDDVELFLGNVETTGKGKAKGLAATGGRVLTVTATADTVEEAAAIAQRAADAIVFDGKHQRADIAAAAGIFV